MDILIFPQSSGDHRRRVPKASVARLVRYLARVFPGRCFTDPDGDREGKAANGSDGWGLAPWATGDQVRWAPSAPRRRGLVSEPKDGDARPTHVTETLMAAGAIMPGALVAPAATDRKSTRLNSSH